MSKRSVMFSVRGDAPPQELQAVIAQVKELDGVSEAGVLFPDAADAKLRRMGFANLKESANPQDLVQQVSSLPKIEQASLAAERGLN